MTIGTPVSFKLNDGTSIPWLAWGNGTGGAKTNALECGRAVLESGIRHIDTAQLYHTEKETGDSISQSSFAKEDVYVTSKLSPHDDGSPLSLDEVPSRIGESISKLGFVPDLFLIHNPYVAKPGELKSLWKILEDYKDQGKLKSIGVSNFRPQDLEEILDGAKNKPVVNQLEYHPYTLAHLSPLIVLQEAHGIVTESYGVLTPILRHPTGGPLKPILERIAVRISQEHGKTLDIAIVLLLWTRAKGVVAVTASGNIERIKRMGELVNLPELLTPEEVREIDDVGKTVHFRHYSEHMEKDFALPDLPSA